MDIHHHLLKFSDRVDGIQYFCARALREWPRGKTVRRLSLHPSEPDAFDDRSLAGADHHDVAESRRGKRSAGGRAGFQSESEERADAGRVEPQATRARRANGSPQWCVE